MNWAGRALGQSEDDLSCGIRESNCLRRIFYFCEVLPGPRPQSGARRSHVGDFWKLKPITIATTKTTFVKAAIFATGVANLYAFVADK